ncbi:MAG: hypothetical protein IT208_05040 [Chthonomonadales bacterium]|nr:hypothetical protein [Chthonomonadales bacterium]
MPRGLIAGLALIFGCALSGCNGGAPSRGQAPLSAAESPLGGVWTGQSDMKDQGLGFLANAVAGGPLTGPSRLRLDVKGTGFLKVADRPEQPISWKAEDGKVTIKTRDIEDGDSAEDEEGGPWSGTLSDDDRQCVLT